MSSPRIPDACRCGRPWVRVHHDNSGTTEIRRACPRVADTWSGIDYYSWRALPSGHQFVVYAKSDAAASLGVDVATALGVETVVA